MLRLQLPTDPRWVELVKQDLSEILTDHAYCEQKAASTAISLIIHYPEYPELVHQMALLAQEEMNHFQRVFEIIRARGMQLGRERKDNYVNELFQQVRKNAGKVAQLIDRLLVAALIEARSCERFKLLSEKLADKELADFYKELMVSEAGHYVLFLSLARDIGGREQTDARWQEWLAIEAEIIRNYGHAPTMHG